MAERTKPVSLRLTLKEIEQLRARAFELSATVPGVARDLIRVGLAGGSNRSLVDRLMHVERRLAAVEQSAQDTNAKASAVDAGVRDLLAMFEALLQALSDESSGRNTIPATPSCRVSGLAAC
jgi:hypothetical protein